MKYRKPTTTEENLNKYERVMAIISAIILALTLLMS